MARGGLSFFSPTRYTQGSLIEVAVPYSSRVPNIFAPARIVHYRIVDGGNFAYGVSFIGD
jgi:predicted acylesterase/phospholipase RssA